MTSVEFKASEAEFKAKRLRGKINFFITKNNNQVTGFILSGPIANDEHLARFFLRLPRMVHYERIKISVTKSLKSLVIYDPKFIGASMLKFSIDNLDEARELQTILNKNGCKLSISEMENLGSLGCKIVA